MNIMYSKSLDLFIPRTCPNITSLRLLLGDKVLRGEQTLHFGQSFFRKLTRLTIEGNVHLHGFAFLWGHCQNLKYIRIGQCQYSSHYSMYILCFLHSRSRCLKRADQHECPHPGCLHSPVPGDHLSDLNHIFTTKCKLTSFVNALVIKLLLCCIEVNKTLHTLLSLAVIITLAPHSLSVFRLTRCFIWRRCTSRTSRWGPWPWPHCWWTTCPASSGPRTGECNVHFFNYVNKLYKLS